MKSAVNAFYQLLWLREYDPHSYEEQVASSVRALRRQGRASARP